MKGRSILAAALLVLFIVIIGLTVWGIDYTSSSDFCDSCHIIQPYVDTWKQSAMGQAGVECIDCHFEPGVIGYGRGKIYSLMKLVEYGTGQYERKPPTTELLTNSACLQKGCHDGVITPGADNYLDPKYFPVREGEDAASTVYFPHQFHIETANLKCADCHSGIVHGAELVDKPQAQLDPEFCANCHTGDIAPILFGNIKLSGREHPGVPKIDTAIWRNIHWRFAGGPGEYKGEHYDQIEKKTCMACHDEPYKAKNCKSCHSAEVPEFSVANETQEASAAPLTMFGLVIGIFLVTLVPYPKVKRFIFEGWIAAGLAVIVLATDVYAFVKVIEVVSSATEGEHSIGPVTIWIAYLLASASLLVFLFHQGVLKPRRRRLSKK